MKTTTLEAFITRFRDAPLPRSEYVKADGFSSLYVRLGPYYLPGDVFGKPTENVFVIANVKAKKSGNGAFTKLVESLFDRGFIVYVECIHNERLRNHLLRNGFQDATLHNNLSFESLYKKPEQR